MIGHSELAFIHQLLLDQTGGMREQIFCLLKCVELKNQPQSTIVRDVLIPQAAAELKDRLTAMALRRLWEACSKTHWIGSTFIVYGRHKRSKDQRLAAS
jgi:hypothetical protein